MDEAESLREFVREILLRHDRALQRSDRRIAELIRQGDEDRRVYLARFEKLDAKAEELLAEGRAQRQALLAILDRLGGGGAAPAT